MEKPPVDDDDHRRRGNLVALVAVVALVALGIWLLIVFKQENETVDCYAAGHKDCAQEQNQ